MSLNIYLTFDGNCRKAFAFYRSVFGGDFTAEHTFREAPPEMEVAEADKDRVMHVSLQVGESTLMGSDTAGGHGGPLVVGTNFAISVVADGRKHADELFAKLRAGGEVQMPMQDTFWGSYFGMCRDRFDINWMINYAEEGSKA